MIDYLIAGGIWTSLMLIAIHLRSIAKDVHRIMVIYELNSMEEQP